MSVYDFVEMCIDPDFLKVELFDVDKNEVIFNGMVYDMPEVLGCYYEVGSFDIPDKAGEITLNVYKEV